MAVSLTVDADLARLAEVRQFVRATLATALPDPTATNDLVQAVDEVVTNVIKHGYRGRPGSVEIEIEMAGDAIVHVRDLCVPFDPTTLPSPDVGAPLARRPHGGMGVHLSRVLTDGMTHRILPTGGNELTLVKRLGGAGGGEADGDPG